MHETFLEGSLSSPAPSCKYWQKGGSTSPLLGRGTCPSSAPCSCSFPPHWRAPSSFGIPQVCAAKTSPVHSAPREPHTRRPGQFGRGFVDPQGVLSSLLFLGHVPRGCLASGDIETKKIFIPCCMHVCVFVLAAVFLFLGIQKLILYMRMTRWQHKDILIIYACCRTMRERPVSAA